MTHPQTAAALTVLAGIGALAGCATNGTGAFESARPTPTEPAVFVDGASLDPPEITTRTAELAGGVVVEELALERALELACRQAGIAIERADIDRERSALVDAVLAERDGRQENTALLLDRVRARRGLGPIRFEALLRRNAMLRALVHDSINVTETEIRLAHEMNAGPRARVRLIVTPSRQAASGAIERIRDDAATVGLVQAFADAARRVSTHASAAAGGSLGIVSPLDPALPESLRGQIAAARAGGLTEIVPIGDSYGVALIEAVIEPQLPRELTPGRRAEIRQEITRRKERLEMERLAIRLVRESEIRVVDPSLGWSFRTRTERGE
ncbi:MAG: hypothetical protein RIB60_09065 [Phycisphaerales bacterium]